MPEFHHSRAVNAERYREKKAKSGEQILREYPEIRDDLRYRSGRFELRRLDRATWAVVSPREAMRALSIRHFLAGLWADRVLAQIKLEGRGLPSDDMNPLLLEYPEFTKALREECMPRIRELFCYHEGAFFEWDGEQWWQILLSALRRRIEQRFRRELAGVFKTYVRDWAVLACIEELKLEGKQ